MVKKQQQTTFVVLLIVFVIMTIFQIATWAKEEEPMIITTDTVEGEWECIQTECSRFMTPQELVNNICFLDNQSMMMCAIDVDDQQFSIPLTQLNISAFQVCAEYNCVKEALVRPANYLLVESQ